MSPNKDMTLPAVDTTYEGPLFAVEEREQQLRADLKEALDALDSLLHAPPEHVAVVQKWRAARVLAKHRPTTAEVKL